MTRTDYIVEIQTCVGLVREASRLLGEATGAERVGCFYPLGGAYETKAWPPAPEQILPHLPAVLTATASGLIIVDHVARMAKWFRDRRIEHPEIPRTRLRIKKLQDDEALLDIDLETDDPALAVEVARQIVQTSTILVGTALPSASLFHRGKVRDTYDLGDRLLMVATDRISAFDVVLPNGIPDKGRVLTQLSAFWFELIGDVVPNHFLRLIDSTEAADVPFAMPPELVGRSMLIRKARRVDVECVARGYLAGSGWQEYQETGKVCGVRLPPGLRESEELPDPIFTPATKAASGHDLNITFDQVVELVGERAASVARARTLAVYSFARDYARQRGIIIADTKLEFGWLPAEGGSASGGDDEFIVIDELLTPDSSRFWSADGYQPGRPQPSFDKQPVRDWLIASGWNKEPPAPVLPPEVVASTAERYREAFRRLTGREIMVP